MGDVKRLNISTEALRRMLSHVRMSQPREAVGLLGGSAAGEVLIVLPLTNIAPGNKTFLADPFEQFSALQKLQAEDLELLAIYHSHPEGGVEPSQQDLAYAEPWACAHVLIAFGVDAESEARIRAYRFDGRGDLEVVAVQLPGA